MSDISKDPKVVTLACDKYLEDGAINPRYLEGLLIAVEGMVRSPTKLTDWQCTFCDIIGVVMKKGQDKYYCECNCLDVGLLVRDSEYTALVAWYVNRIIKEHNEKEGEK